MTPCRRATALALLVALVGLAGCASVPESSPVQVLRQVGGGEETALSLEPVDGSNPLDLVRDFVFASGVSTDMHESARRFLAPEAQEWDAAASLIVLDGQFDTVPAPDAQDQSTGVTTIRIRGTAIGHVTSSGSFEPDQVTFQRDVTVVRRDGQWRISALPGGVVVPSSTFQANYRAVHTWFVDPGRGLLVADLRYLPSMPLSAQAARALELLLAGPSAALTGAAVSQLPPDARLRSNVMASLDGVLIVDLTGIDDLEEPARQLLAAQVVLSLAEVDVDRVRLLVDGEPLLPGQAELARADVAGLVAEVAPGPGVPGLVVSDGRLRQLTGSEPGTPLPGPVGDGTYDVESAAFTVDGQRLAVVVRQDDRRVLLFGDGPEGGLTPVLLDAATMTRPSWTPRGAEVWTVVDSTAVVRVLVDDTELTRRPVNADELTELGPISDLRLSRDGMRVVAVVGGGLYTASVERGVDGAVSIGNIRRLRPIELDEVVAADWWAAESVVAITRGPELLVAHVSVDGLDIAQILGNNLTPPLTAVAATSDRSLLVTDRAGVWSVASDDQTAWRQVLPAAPDAVPLYPG
ncbi:MAG: LpqB family beta-propeller domain-containing protein [Pseudonocardia sp.]